MGPEKLSLAQPQPIQGLCCQEDPIFMPGNLVSFLFDRRLW